jgi:hypothetical protein
VLRELAAPKEHGRFALHPAGIHAQTVDVLEQGVGAWIDVPIV